MTTTLYWHDYATFGVDLIRTLNDFYEQIVPLRHEREGDMDAQKILDVMEAWGRDLLAA